MGNPPYRLECRYADGHGGREYVFASRCLGEDPQAYAGRLAAVCAGSSGYGRYAADLDSGGTPEAGI